MPYKTFTLCLLLVICESASSFQLSKLIADYQSSKESWFSVTGGNRTYKLGAEDEQVLHFPNYVWITNLTKSIDIERYRLCETCLLRKKWIYRDYLREQESWVAHSKEYFSSLQRFFKADYWRLAKLKAHAYLTEMYHERGAMATALTALTWLPYTALTEGVIEPILIGPLHAVCPIFQVVYFGALNTIHSTYSNLLHSLSFYPNEISLGHRLSLLRQYYQHLPAGNWQAGEHDINEINPMVGEENNDPLTKRLLSSQLAKQVAANLLAPPTVWTKNDSSNQEVIYQQLINPARVRQIYLIDSIVQIAALLTNLVAKDLDTRIERQEINARDYRLRKGALGKAKKGIFVTEMHLKKYTIIPSLVKESHIAPVYVNFHLLAEITQQSLALLLNALTYIQQPNADYQSAIDAFVEKVKEYSASAIVYNLTSTQRK